MKRFFFSTGEASGELSATVLADAIARVLPDASFAGIGSERMQEAGFDLMWNTRGWSSMGPLGALSRIPKLTAILFATASRLLRHPADLVVLVDFGAFNVRLARLLRRFGYAGSLLYFFPPGAWLDNLRVAQIVAAHTAPLTPFKHQRDFYRAADLPVAYFGHPLAGLYTMRRSRPAPPYDGGTIALLPGSRRGELTYHVPILLRAARRLQIVRPNAQFIAGAADRQAKRFIAQTAQRCRFDGIHIVDSAIEALESADGAWIASGTAVLQAALLGVPNVAFYVVSAATARIARRVYRGPYISIPNLVLRRAAIPELLQEAATPENLAQSLHTTLQNPDCQYAAFTELRTALGPADALAQCADFAVRLSGS
ncbi:MAG: hypothetical protein M3Z14_07585 [Candidatus Eremiobacteraeota bacterium]|nr:hypothetical protein [Candidatus Eremiobacteraeota bacterium]